MAAIDTDGDGVLQLKELKAFVNANHTEAMEPAVEKLRHEQEYRSAVVNPDWGSEHFRKTGNQRWFGYEKAAREAGTLPPAHGDARDVNGSLARKRPISHKTRYFKKGHAAPYRKNAKDFSTQTHDKLHKTIKSQVRRFELI